ncbi:MAG: hypothetical protein ACOY32_07230 [Thermodesulfobacteriota bacterium]
MGTIQPCHPVWKKLGVCRPDKQHKRLAHGNLSAINCADDAARSAFRYDMWYESHKWNYLGFRLVWHPAD